MANRPVLRGRPVSLSAVGASGDRTGPRLVRAPRSCLQWIDPDKPGSAGSPNQNWNGSPAPLSRQRSTGPLCRFRVGLGQAAPSGWTLRSARCRRDRARNRRPGRAGRRHAAAPGHVGRDVGPEASILSGVNPACAHPASSSGDQGGVACSSQAPGCAVQKGVSPGKRCRLRATQR